MAEAAAQQAQHEFWRPPMAASDPAAHVEMVETCDRCGTEFIVESRYCHSCGAGRAGLSDSSSWQGKIALAELTGRGDKLGLPTAAFLAFGAGILCLLGAIGVGVVFSSRTTLDWQAIQLWRIQWLLGSVAAFAAGCLLKRSR